MMLLPRAVGLLTIGFALAACGEGAYNPNRPSSPTTTTTIPIQNYAGNWSGTYTVTGCNQNGGMALANLCGSALGETPPYRFSFTQGGQNVSGTFSLGSITFPNTGGTVASDGSLALSAVNQANGLTTIVKWALQFPSSTIIGTVTQNIESSTLTGSVVIVGTINSAIHGNLTPSSVWPPPSSLAEALHRMLNEE